MVKKGLDRPLMSLSHQHCQTRPVLISSNGGSIQQFPDVLLLQEVLWACLSTVHNTGLSRHPAALRMNAQQDQLLGELLVFLHFGLEAVH